MALSKKKIMLFAAFSVLIMSGCDNHQTPVAESSPNDLYCKNLSTLGSVPVKVHRLDDQYCYPVGIFANPTDPDKCSGTHYHYNLISLDGHERPDEGADCGAAKQSDIEATGYYYVSPKVIESWNELWAKQGQEKIDIAEEAPE